MIFKKKKPHKIGETLIKPCMLKVASHVLIKVYSKKKARISLSDSTIKTLIDELAKNIECHKFSKNYNSHFFSIQCD